MKIIIQLLKTLLAVLVFAFVGYCIGYVLICSDVDLEKYHEVNQWVKEEPGLRPMVEESMQDGHISQWEYSYLSNEYHRLLKLRLMSPYIKVEEKR